MGWELFVSLAGFEGYSQCFGWHNQTPVASLHLEHTASQSSHPQEGGEEQSWEMRDNHDPWSLLGKTSINQPATS